MPWWFWPLAVLWGVPLAVAAFLVGYAVLRDRRAERARMDVEARAVERLTRRVGEVTVDTDVIAGQLVDMGEQRFNPRVHGRPDRWRT